MDKFNVMGVVWRVLFSLALVFLTFNPSGHSFFHWLMETFPSIQPVTAIAGIVLIAAWLFFVRSTFNAMGSLGIGLLVAFFAAVVWFMVKQGWLSIHNRAAMAWVVLTIVGIVLGIGMSWSLIRQRISGQTSVDRVDT
jgi:hypothetical protein